MRTKIFFLLLLMSVYLEMLRRPAFYENAGLLIINPKNTPFLIMGELVGSKVWGLSHREAPCQPGRSATDIHRWAKDKKKSA